MQEEKKGRPIVNANVGQELLDFLDGLPGPDGEANRSYHVRRALRAYRAGGVDGIGDALEELARKAREAEPPDPMVVRFGAWMVELPTEVRRLVFLIGQALAKDPDSVSEYLGHAGMAPDTSSSARTKRKP